MTLIIFICKKAVYILIKRKNAITQGINISHLGKNGEDVLIEITKVENLSTLQQRISMNVYNYDKYISGKQVAGRLLEIPNVVTVPNPTEDINHSICSVLKLGQHIEKKLGLVRNKDFFVMAQPEWVHPELPFRISMLETEILDKYSDLINHVKSLGVPIYKVFDARVMYFPGIQPDHAKLIGPDPKVLIENINQFAQ